MLPGTWTPTPANIDLTNLGTIDRVQWPGNGRKGVVAAQISSLDV
jgi:hypothetical protein